MESKVYWISEPPSNCDLCKKQIETIFVDGKTRMGPWGFMCLYCHRVHGYGLGTGRGQMYRKQPDKKWLKVTE